MKNLLGPNITRIGVSALIVVAIAYPFLNEAPQVQSLGLVLVLSIAVIGLNLLTGYTGQISIGHSAFFGTGAYAHAILVSREGWPQWAGMLAGFTTAAILGLICGIPALRIRGIYLALVTLALATVFPAVVNKYSDLTGGSQGLVVPRLKAPEWTGLANDQFAYLVALAFVLGAVLITRNIVGSRSGRALMSLADNETASLSMGINVATMKVLAFTLSAGLAGIAGSLFVATQGFISPQTSFVTLMGSIQFLTAMVVGGVASILGPIIGTYLTQLLPEVLSDFSPGLSQVFYGGLLVLLMLVVPDGMVGAVRRAWGWGRSVVAKGNTSHEASPAPPDPSELSEVSPRPSDVPVK